MQLVVQSNNSLLTFCAYNPNIGKHECKVIFEILLNILFPLQKLKNFVEKTGNILCGANKMLLRSFNFIIFAKMIKLNLTDDNNKGLIYVEKYIFRGYYEKLCL